MTDQQFNTRCGSSPSVLDPSPLQMGFEVMEYNSQVYRHRLTTRQGLKA